MRRVASTSALLVLALLAACSSAPQKAPVEERKPVPLRPAAAASAASASASQPGATEATAGKPMPGAENAGKPGYYTVKQGDTLIRLALDYGLNWRDLARWNGLANPDLIEVGQVLRVVPPVADATVASTRPVTSSGRVETRPLEGKAPAAASAAAAAASAPAATTTTTASAAAPASAPAASTPAPKDPDEDINWLWPAAGPVATPFDEAKNKGLDIVGKAGDPVLAAADGRVVYAGAGLRGLGNLVIIKHNGTYLTAYAHNQTLLVKEEQGVRRGQKIAEMGSSDAERVQLHFEIRKQGKPIDPAKLLPAR